jgi:hypothetical protein
MKSNLKKASDQNKKRLQLLQDRLSNANSTAPDGTPLGWLNTSSSVFQQAIDLQQEIRATQPLKRSRKLSPVNDAIREILLRKPDARAKEVYKQLDRIAERNSKLECRCPRTRIWLQCYKHPEHRNSLDKRVSEAKRRLTTS